MATRKVYFNDTTPFMEVEFKKIITDSLCMTISNTNTKQRLSVCLSKKDAVALISELAFQFSLVNDDMEYPRPMWEGNPR
jgi:hypothetical protein